MTAESCLQTSKSSYFDFASSANSVEIIVAAVQVCHGSVGSCSSGQNSYCNAILKEKRKFEKGKTMELHVCQFQFASTEGFTPQQCAHFCAHPRSETVANGSKGGRLRIAPIHAANQPDSKPS
jgi:hypothetical protein